jgi:hypothetical protein
VIQTFAADRADEALDIFASASILTALAGIAVDVISLFMALLSSREISAPSLQAQGERRRSSYFNNDRDIA